MLEMLNHVSVIKNCADQLNTSGGTDCQTTLPQIGANSGSLETILTIVFGVVTGVAVIILVIQGIRFVLSQGEPEKSGQARRGVIYAAVGLVIVFMADVVVGFILGRFF